MNREDGTTCAIIKVCFKRIQTRCHQNLRRQFVPRVITATVEKPGRAAFVAVGLANVKGWPPMHDCEPQSFAFIIIQNVN